MGRHMLWTAHIAILKKYDLFFARIFDNLCLKY